MILCPAIRRFGGFSVAVRIFEEAFEEAFEECSRGDRNLSCLAIRIQ